MNAPVKPDEFWHLHESAIATEQALLGICMMEPQAFTAVQSWISDHHFQEAAHQKIWGAMEGLAADGRPVTPITVVSKLGNTEFAGINLRTYIARCAADTSCPAPYAVDYAKQVREHWCLREVAAVTADARSFALAPGADARNLIADVMQRLDETRSVIDGRVVGGRSAAAVASSVVTRLADLRSGAVKDHAVTTGLADLDRKLNGGFRPGELIVIAGRPGMGKTIVGASCARQAAKAGHAGILFSLEMSEQQIGARLLADEAYSGVNSTTASQIVSAHLGDTQALSITNAAASFGGLPLSIDCSPSLTVGEIGARARTAMKRLERQGRRLEFVTIDYLKFVRSTDRYRGNRVLEVGEITAGLKSLAKDLDIAIVLLAQLNRQNEQLADKRPDLAHLRDSGEIEQDADTVLLLYREAYYLSKDPSTNHDPEKGARLARCMNELEIIVAKQRMGSVGNVNVYCHPGAAAVRDLMKGY